KSRGVTAIPRKVKSTKLPLPARGPLWIGVTWKNLISIRRGSGPVLGLLVGIMAVSMLVVASAARARRGADEPAIGAPLFALGAVFIAGFLCIIGPISIASDLRQDMPMFDVLRTLPLRGRELLLGEVMGPALVLGASQWGLWILASAVTWNQRLPEIV